MADVPLSTASVGIWFAQPLSFVRRPVNAAQDDLGRWIHCCCLSVDFTWLPLVWVCDALGLLLLFVGQSPLLEMLWFVGSVAAARDAALRVLRVLRVFEGIRLGGQ